MKLMNRMLSGKKTRYVRQLAMTAFVMLVTSPVLAGSGSGGTNPFSGVTGMLIEWLKGGLGLMLAIISLVCALIAGIARGSIVGVLTCVAIAICAYWGPDILQLMFGATLPFAPSK